MPTHVMIDCLGNCHIAGDLIVDGDFSAAGAIDLTDITKSVSCLDVHTQGTLGVWGEAGPVAQPGDFTQAYATADKTIAALTAEDLEDASGGAADATGDIVAMASPADAPATADALRDDLVANFIPALRNNIATLAAQFNALRLDVLAMKKNDNAMVDTLQEYGFVG